MENDKNTAVLFISSALMFVVLGWIASDFFRQDELFSDTTIGAVVGGFLAGLFGLLAAGYSIFYAQAERKRNSQLGAEAKLHSIVTKLIDLDDKIEKNRRHFMTHDKMVKIFFGSGNSFTKPLEGIERHIDFSIEERTFLLRKYGAERFNDLSDILGISESLTFLLGKHLKSYYELMDEVFESETERSGYNRTATIDKDSVRLMTLMDAEGALKSLLVS
ncbi:MAG: hypothetical protein OTI35_17580, partial [Sulfitobacter sp.]|nr:hypothetical protein [Sulfitobacter sp.]